MSSARVFAEMEAAGVDALVLGRPANVAFTSGARQLWTAGARPFGPACIAVRATGRVHLLSTWDEGIPAAIAHDDLFGLSWNPATIAANVAAVPGLRSAGRVGTDGMSPGFTQLLRSVAPDAALVDGAAIMERARRVKTPDEVELIVAACRIAEAALDAMAAAVRPGITERQLVGVYLASIAASGAPTPPTEGVVCSSPRQGPVVFRQLASSRVIGPGELVALNPGALVQGYEGGIGRTVVAGSSAGAPPVVERVRAGVARVVEACRPGATGAELIATWGEPLTTAPLVVGLGLGIEPPVVGAGVGAAAVLEEGMVLAVQGWCASEGDGGALSRDVVRIEAAGPSVLTRAVEVPGRR